MAKPYNSEREIPLTVQMIDHAKDFAILNFVNKNNEPDASLTIGKSSELRLGENLLTIGNLNNYGLSCNSGILSSYKKTFLTTMYIMNIIKLTLK